MLPPTLIRAGAAIAVTVTVSLAAPVIILAVITARSRTLRVSFRAGD
jgi:hypothetical protein